MSTDSTIGNSSATEFVFQVPDEVHQILLIEIAGNHGLQAFIRLRSKRRVWILGAKPEVDAVAATAQRLAAQLKVLQLNAVFKVLLKHELVPSLHLARLISLAEVKAAAASAQKPPPREASASKSKEGSNESNSH
jgi:hypothetical protein